MTGPLDETRGALLLALRRVGIRDVGVLRAIETVRREEFLPDSLRHLGSRNVAVPIACGQTMPSPLSLALVLDALAVRPTDRVLEIGTGSGYATAILARLAREVVSIERYRTLATAARARLAPLGLSVEVVVGDGLEFPAQFGAFERIVVHAALPAIPPSLAEALADGGRIVAGVPEKDGEPAALAAFETDGTAFTCRRLHPMRLGLAEKGAARAL